MEAALSREIVAAPVEGWRVWLIRHTAEGPRLASIGVQHVWSPPFEQARCLAGGRSITFITEAPGLRLDEHAPAADCMCGLWALSAERLAALFNDDLATYPIVVGTVEMWGRIVEGEQGFRAEHARPRVLYVNDMAAHVQLALALHYGVEVRKKAEALPVRIALRPGRVERRRWWNVALGLALSVVANAFVWSIDWPADVPFLLLSFAGGWVLGGGLAGFRARRRRLCRVLEANL